VKELGALGGGVSHCKKQLLCHIKEHQLLLAGKLPVSVDMNENKGAKFHVKILHGRKRNKKLM